MAVWASVTKAMGERAAPPFLWVGIQGSGWPRAIAPELALLPHLGISNTQWTNFHGEKPLGALDSSCPCGSLSSRGSQSQSQSQQGLTRAGSKGERGGREKLLSVDHRTLILLLLVQGKKVIVEG